MSEFIQLLFRLQFTVTVFSSFTLNSCSTLLTHCECDSEVTVKCVILNE